MSLFDEDRLRSLVAEEVRRVLREELPRGPSHAEYLSVVEAARVAAVSPDTIRRWMTAGRLERHNAGRELRVRRSDLEHLLAGGRPSIVSASPEEAARQYLAARRKSPG